jgi:hypothetical protein
MNRIILVGNGFDLAHGLKSSYKDFVLDLIKEKIKQAVKEGVKTNFSNHQTGYFYEDELLKIYIQNFNNIKEYIQSVIDVTELDTLIEISKNGSFGLVFKSKILKNFFEHWADLEKAFFDSIVEAYEKKGDVEKLNNDFLEIKKLLDKYIKNQQIFIEDEKIESKRIEKIIQIFKNKNPNELLFLSFNYTRTLGYYFNLIQHEIKSEIIYLHGNTNGNGEDEIIFGYDNDKDDNFNLILKNSNIYYLKFFKSILYLNNDNKIKLDNFINKEEFEVYIFGHSCGESDFTILSEILEIENCKRIEFFYNPLKGIEDFDDNIRRLAMLFKDKKNLKKIVPKNQVKAMPQIKSIFKVL